MQNTSLEPSVSTPRKEGTGVAPKAEKRKTQLLVRPKALGGHDLIKSLEGYDGGST